MSFICLSLFLILAVFVVSTDTSATADPLVGSHERWVCLGDSITAMNCYPKMLSRVFQHFHPDDSLTIINSGVGGDTASDDPQKLENRVLQHNPTIVSIMYGMNEAINIWRPDQPRKPVLDHYRNCLVYMTRTLRDKGVKVLLMSPTLTDPSCHTFFTLDKTIPFLHECAKIMREVAAQEGAIYVPVQEEFEAFQDTLPARVILRPDGVHPSSLGQYRIAQSLWEHTNFAAVDPSKSCAAAKPPTLVPVTVSLNSRFLSGGDDGIPLLLTSAAAQTVDITYNQGNFRGQETVHLASGTTMWTLHLPSNHIPQRIGEAQGLVMDIRSGDTDAVYIIDLCRTALLHLSNDTVAGTIKSETDNSKVADWKVTRTGDDLLFDFDVLDDQIHSESLWPFGRDGLNLMLDLRPTSRFAGIVVDRDVYQAFLTLREKPFFAVKLYEWLGEGLDYAATVGGERTPSGYAAHMLIHDQLDLHTPFNLKDRDFVGLLVAVDDQQTGGGMTITTNQKNDETSDLYANNMPILDLKNTLPGDSIVNLSLFTAQ